MPPRPSAPARASGFAAAWRRRASALVGAAGRGAASRAAAARRGVDDLEEVLIGADVGVVDHRRLLDPLRSARRGCAARRRFASALAEAMRTMLEARPPPAPSSDTVGRPGHRRERRREDHDDRKARGDARRGRAPRPAGRGRHVPRRRHRPARRLGRTRGRRPRPARAGRRSVGRSVRRLEGGAWRGASMSCWSTRRGGSIRGRPSWRSSGKVAPGHRPRDSGRPARDPAGRRCHDRTERGQPGAHFPGGRPADGGRR